MLSSHEKNFGILISIVLPGFIGLLGFADQSELIQIWIGQAGVEAPPTVGGFLLLTVASVFVGMVFSLMRWAVIDPIQHRTGICKPDWQLANLKDREQAFEILRSIHYQWFQFYSNSIVAILFFLIGRTTSVGFSFAEWFLGIVVAIVFFAGSRDTLRKYYERVDSLLST